MTINEIKKQFDNTPTDKLVSFISDHKDDERPGVVALVNKAHKKISDLEKELERTEKLKEFEV